MDIYKLMRDFWDFSFENTGSVKPLHIAVYFFAIEHCNRLGWKEIFGFPTAMVLDAVGIKSYNTYKKTLDDLVGWGFIIMIEKSKNQYSSNIIALSYFNKPLDKALDKAFTKHASKQSESTIQSTGSINRQIYNNTNIQTYNGAREEIINIDEGEIKKAIDLICDFFHVDEGSNFKNFQLVVNFCKRHNEKLLFVMKQCDAYSKYKSKSEEKLHSLKGFIGLPENDYQDGGFYDRDWIKAFDSLNQKNNYNNTKEKLEKINNQKRNVDFNEIANS